MVGCVSECIAFEPRTWQAEYLRQLARYAELPIVVEQMAVSNVDGHTVLRIPVAQQGLSTIESGNSLLDADGSTGIPAISIEVTTQRLDSYCGSMSLGFVKIDVEGHEGAVLEGATSLLRKQRPRLLIEVEDRHRAGAVRDVFDLIDDYGYAGFFLHNEQLIPISEFNAAVHQDPRNSGGWKTPDLPQPLYINNFVFIPEEERAEISVAAAELLSARALE
jgi:FkbM family methyltransferase